MTKMASNTEMATNDWKRNEENEAAAGEKAIENQPDRQW